jgi:hypothetical protein
MYKPSFFKFCFVLVILVTAGIGLFVWQKAAVVSQFHDWNLLPKPERLTELYFSKYATLPSTYATAQGSNLAFTIHNSEYRTTQYTYRIVAQAENSDTMSELNTGSATLARDELKSLTAQINVPPGPHDIRTKIEVRLTYESLSPKTEQPSQKQQSIHYWIQKDQNPPSKQVQQADPNKPGSPGKNVEERR